MIFKVFFYRNDDPNECFYEIIYNFHLESTDYYYENKMLVREENRLCRTENSYGYESITIDMSKTFCFVTGERNDIMGSITEENSRYVFLNAFDTIEEAKQHVFSCLEEHPERIDCEQFLHENQNTEKEALSNE